MNIIDAIKSGKEYYNKRLSLRYLPDRRIHHTQEEILSDDWEVGSTFLTCSEEDLKLALGRMYDVGVRKGENPDSPPHAYNKKDQIEYTLQQLPRVSK